jgi:hypothetical protein
MNHEHSADSVGRLLERLCIDGLTDDDWQELTEMIADDEQALRSYVEAVQWRQSMGYLVGTARNADHPSLPFLEDLTAGETTGDLAHRGSSRAIASDPSARRSSTINWRALFGPWSLAVSVAFLAGAGIAAVALRQGAESPLTEVAQTAPDAPQLPSPRVTLVQESQLGRISGLSQEASADGLLRSLKVGQDLRCGEVIQLTVGFIRVALHSGPELIIEGPAEFSIVGNDIVFVRSGRVAASRTGKLLLQSPLVAAECNDADVSFVADDDTSTNVFAYKGVVTMRSIAHRRVSSRKLAVLHGGQGLLVRPDFATAGLAQISTVPPTDTVRSWTEIEAKLNEFERLVLSDRPVAYWPLLRVRRNRRVLDLTQHGYDGQAIGNWPGELNEAATSEERGAFFNGECYIEPDRKPRIDLRNGFTVEGWAKVHGGPNYQAIFTTRWVLDAHAPHLQCLGFTLYAGKDDCWELWTGSGRYGQLWKELHSNVPLVRHQWTHVVATFDPDASATDRSAESVTGTVRIYVDGKFAAEDVHEMSLLDFEWPARIGAAEFVPNSLTAWLFRGTLRDIAVYDYPLEAGRIEAHYRVGKNAG